jgi:hypothetical protein
MHLPEQQVSEAQCVCLLELAWLGCGNIWPGNPATGTGFGSVCLVLMMFVLKKPVWNVATVCGTWSRGHPLGQCFRHPISSFVFLPPKLSTFGRCFSLTNRIFGEYRRPLASFWTVFLSLNLIFGQIIRGSPDFTFFLTVFQFSNLTFLQYSSTYPYLSTVFRFSNLQSPSLLDIIF